MLMHFFAMGSRRAGSVIKWYRVAAMQSAECSVCRCKNEQCLLTAKIIGLHSVSGGIITLCLPAADQLCRPANQARARLKPSRHKLQTVNPLNPRPQISHFFSYKHQPILDRLSRCPLRVAVVQQFNFDQSTS